MQKQKLITLLVAVLVVGCMPTSNSPSSATKADPEIEELISKMTVEEKVGQMAQVTLDVISKGPNEFSSDEPLSLDPAIVKKALVDYKVGSILNTGNNRARTPEKWFEIISELQRVAMEETNLGIPIIYGVDAIHGVTYTAGATFFPQEIAQAASWNPEIARRGAEICAYETRASCIPWNFSPVLDIGRDPRFPRIWETFGEDVLLAKTMGVQMIKGYEGEDNNIADPEKLASCLKHYLGYSVPKSGKDRTPAYIPEIELRERHLPTFKAAVEAGAHTLMVNSGLINGIPVHANKNLLITLLREELGFEGVIVTDWADIENLHKRDKVAATQKEAVKMAINAGIDMSMIPYNFKFCDYLVELVNEGEVPMSRIDDAVRRILVLKKKLNLWEKPVTNYKDYPKFGSEEFEQDARNAANEVITLLKNEDGTLPLKKGSKILVAGPNSNSMRTLNGGWTYSWQGEKVEEFASEYKTILEAIQEKAGKANVTHVEGVSYDFEGKYWDEKDINIGAAVKAAAKADYIVLCLGENTYTEKPGDLHELGISQNQIDLALALAKTKKPVILVLNEGRPRLIREIEPHLEGVLHSYLPGNFGGEAIANVLFGDVNPSGKLPYTYPMYSNTLVTYDHKPSEEQAKMDGMYDYESDFAVQYPFGFGLSYTTFEYSDLKINKETFTASEEIELSVTVKNTGKMDGKEVVQLYVSDMYASITPDMKRLRGFEKIDLKAGESKTVTFKITAEDLAFVAADLSTTVEKGEFEAAIGELKQKFSVSETKKFNTIKSVL